MILKSIH